VGEETDLEIIKKEMKGAGLKAGAVCLRYPKTMIRGALTNPDPVIRKEAVRLTKDACRIAKELGCQEVVVWSAYDGYDYTIACDYGKLWDWVVEGFKEVCDEHPDVKVSLEFKPTDENTRFFIVPSTGAALNLCRDVDRDNFGLTLDFGHCLMAGENPAQSAFMAAREGKLFGIQLNDGYSR
jgi:sugar phosphate isomerase/epimerase